MIHAKKLLNFNKSLLNIKYNSNQIAIIDNAYVYHQLDKKTFGKNRSTIIQKDAKVHEYSKKFDISNNSLCVYPKRDSKSLIFIKDENGLKVVSSLKLNENIAITKFSNSSKMLIIGSDTGFLWLYDVVLEKIIYVLAPRADEISSIIFSNDDKLVAIASFDKKIEVYNTKNWEIVYEVELDSVVEDMEFCEDSNYLYSVHRDGNIASLDIEKREIIYTKSLGQHWLRVIKRYKSNNYAIVGARDNDFIILDLKSGKIIKKLSLQSTGLNSLDFSINELFMAFADGNMLVCDMKKNRNEVLVSLKIEDYTKAKELIDANILLYLDGTIEKLYKNGKKVLKEIVKLIELGRIEEAVKEAEPFLGDEKFSREFESYMSQKKEIAQFIACVGAKDFQTAYRLSDEYSYIKELKKYQELEEFWHQSFTEAKNLIAKNPNDSAAKIRAKGKLQAFLNVSCKKDTIKNLLENSIIFFKADTLAKEKKFSEFFVLCQEYSFLEDTKIYNKIMLVAELLLGNISKAIVQKDYANASMTAKKLLSFTPVQDEVERKIIEINAIESFNKAVKEKNYKTAFKLAQEHKFLESLLEYNSILKEFEQEDESAVEYAVAGDVGQAIDTLYEYISIDYLKDRVAFTLKLAYLNSMEPSKYKNSIEWKRTFANYIELYGKDHQLQNIASKYSAMDIFDEIKDDGDSKGYKSKAFKKEVVVLE